MTLGDGIERARYALAFAIAGGKVLHRTGLYKKLSPMAGLKYAAQARGGGGPFAIVNLHALAHPERPALVDGEVRLTYGALSARANRLAHGMRALGIGPGDRVAIMLHNSHHYIELSAAFGHLGAVAVQIGYRSKPAEVAFVLENSGARALVFHADLAATVKEALGAGKITLLGIAINDSPAENGGKNGGHVTAVAGFRDYETVLGGGDPSVPPRVDGGGHGGLMVYTSGTTGRPKGADRDFKATGLVPGMNFLASLPIRTDERHLVTCPLYHSAAPAFAALVMSVGGCLVILDQFDPEAVLATMARERITSAMMVPTMFNRLLGLGRAAIARHDLSSLRCLISGAAPLPTALARRIEEAFGPILYNFYGATETGFVTLALPGEHTARPGTIGRLVGGVEARLVDDAGRDVPTGSVGELFVKSPMLVGYHNNRAATRAAERDGFFSVGDLARRDPEGYFYLADRKSDMVISGGVNIYPFEIEQRLHAHPAVSDVAVVGTPDADWGESLVAFVVLRPDASATAVDLQEFVTAELADFKRPRRVVFLAALPRTPTGKVLKRELKARLAEARE